jgi:hypothetical protein
VKIQEEIAGPSLELRCTLHENIGKLDPTSKTIYLSASYNLHEGAGKLFWGPGRQSPLQDAGALH